MPMIALDQLVAHPENANQMPAELLDKLTEHLRETGKYPPLIVRPLDGAYQLLDGHHRAIALRRLGFTQANCEVWNVDDEQAGMLLLTLNRLHGEDDPSKRGRLLCALQEKIGFEALAARLPDDRGRLKKLIAIAQPPPPGAIAPPKKLDAIPHAVTFFLNGAQRKALFARLQEFDRDRSAALVKALQLESQCENAIDS